jgi:hypothetical protein
MPIMRKLKRIMFFIKKVYHVKTAFLRAVFTKALGHIYLIKYSGGQRNGTATAILTISYSPECAYKDKCPSTYV